MERKIIAAIIVITLFCNALPFLVGPLRAPPGSTYLGAVHYPIDYFYYLSHITQGKDRLLTIQYLYTTESMPPLFLGWLYLPFGRVGSILNILPPVMYQVMLVVFGFLYLFFAYLLICLLITKSKLLRTIAFLLFIFSNTLPRIIQENGKTAIVPYYSWYNFGEPFMRFNAVPHQLFIHASIFMMLVAFLSYPKTRKITWKIFFLAVAAGAGLTLGSTQPVQWVLLCVCLFPVVTFKFFQQQKNLRQAILAALPYILFSGIGLLFAWYVKNLFDRQPFQYMNAWEATQSPFISWQQFIEYHGPVFILGIIGLPWFLKSKNLNRWIVFSICALGLLLFFSPLSHRLPFLNFRYLSALPILLYATSAVVGIDAIAAYTKRFKPLVISMTVTILGFLLVPLFIRNMQEKTIVDTNNVNYYLANGAYDTFVKAGQISSPQDTFLVFWPFETMFPAISGRREYFANQFFTVDYEKKNGLAYTFIDNRMSPTEMQDFLHKNHITYVITYPDAFKNPTPFLKSVYDNHTLVIQKVL